MSLAPLRILVIEDDSLQQMLLRSLIESAGYEVVTADNGDQAMASFRLQPPDVILLDYELPDTSGRELVRTIRSQQRDWLPILFLSAHTSVEVQRDCLLSGGDDYIIKPYDFTILDAKIQAMCRLATMQRQIREQTAQLQRHIEAEAAESEAAHYLYNRLISAEETPIPGFHRWLQPASKFSGDIICSATGSNGHHYFLLADATGHGLSAAIGLIPVTQVFYSMSRKGHHISRIVREMNQQVRRFTPSYRFVAAVVVEVDPFALQLDVWNGGMPVALRFHHPNGSTHSFVSRHVALGLSSDQEFNPDVESAPYAPGDMLLIYSDGLCDAEGPTGQRLGNEQPLELLLQRGHELEMQDIQHLLQEHMAGGSAHDDVAVILCQLSGDIPDSVTASADSIRVVSPCTLTMTLQDQLIGEFDLIPSIVEWCRRTGLTEQAIARLHTILMELVTNAVEHGILLLDSKIKSEPNGFFRYLEERAKRLQHLQDATLAVNIALQPDERGAFAHVTVKDSGPGFDFGNQPLHGADSNAKCGRGLMLVRELAQSVTYHGNGNQVEVVLRL